MKDVPITWPGEVMDFDKIRWDDRPPGEPRGCLREDLADGAASWSRDLFDRIAVLSYVCPCGCKDVGQVPVLSLGAGATWGWDGDEEKPTLAPSIQRRWGCRWHGFLTAGMWKTCA